MSAQACGHPVVVTTRGVTFLQSAGEKCVFPILGAIPTSGFHRLGRPKTTSSLLKLGRGWFLLQEFGSEICARETQNLVLRIGLGLRQGMYTFLRRRR